MHPQVLRNLLAEIAAGRLNVDDALRRLATLPFEDLGFANIDHHRALRCGFPEVVFGAGKSDQQIEEIVARLVARGAPVLATRIGPETARRVQRRMPNAVYHESARVLTLRPADEPACAIDANVDDGFIGVVAAGTADLPVAEEARLTAEALGEPVRTIYDVGVAGLHRLLSRSQMLRAAHVLVVVAGMEGALPSVVGGLVSVPVLAVPTSVGYGASFGGIAALLAMLNSCASNVSVVNIDNGFGAGYQAALINRLARGAERLGGPARQRGVPHGVPAMAPPAGEPPSE